MVSGEIDITPISVDINTRIISFWSKLINGLDNNKLSSLGYDILFTLNKANQKKNRNGYIM